LDSEKNVGNAVCFSSGQPRGDDRIAHVEHVSDDQGTTRVEDEDERLAIPPNAADQVHLSRGEGEVVGVAFALAIRALAEDDDRNVSLTVELAIYLIDQGGAI
jgi:hypothetical protein